MVSKMEKIKVIGKETMRITVELPESQLRDRIKDKLAFVAF